VRIERLDGAHSTELVHPSRPYIEIPAPRGALATATIFLTQGIEHILLGADHLLFVLGLVLIVRSPWMLVKTISAFTVAHSITLAAATLGLASIPAPPLNAAIALSILFLGPEIVRSWRGETSFTIRHPWVVAFAFGLLHGFGFASGLTSAGPAARGHPARTAHVQHWRRDRPARIRGCDPVARARLQGDRHALAALGPMGARLCRGLARRVLDD
jgi:hypothetical protein